MQSFQVLIIGAGLSGLTTAYLLQKAGISFLILEARERLGGRIYTKYEEGQASIEMGATWLGNQHQHLLKLLKELDLPYTPQYHGKYTIYDLAHLEAPHLMANDPNAIPSYRIDGGSSQLIQALAKQLDENQLVFGHVVKQLDFLNEGVQIQTNKQTYHAQKVISTLPPALLANTITFSPSLPSNLLDIANQTHTWMGESIKMGIRYASPFWRNGKSSGTILGNNGAVNECYDHSDMEKGYFALKGFIHPALHHLTKEERNRIVVEQLQRYYGEQAKNYLSYEEYVWRNDPLTYVDYAEQVQGHQHNGHVVFREPYFDGRLLVSGSETAKNYPGYMDGAVQSAYRVVQQIIDTSKPQLEDKEVN